VAITEITAGPKRIKRQGKGKFSLSLSEIHFLLSLHIGALGSQVSTFKPALTPWLYEYSGL
jgi:hypothetical protein